MTLGTYHDFEYTIYMFLVFHCYYTGVAYTAQSIDINAPLLTSFNGKHHRPHYGSSSPPTSHDLKCKTSRSPICDLWRWRKLLLLAPPTTHYCTFQLAAAVIIIFGLMCSGCNNITMGFGVFIWVKTKIQLVRSKPISVQPIFVFLCVLLYFCVFLLYLCAFLLYFFVFFWVKTSPGGEE